MLARSVSFTDDSVHLNNSSIDSEYPLDFICFFFGPSSFIFTAYFITYIFLLLPLCIIVLHHGFQQCQKQYATSSRVTMSHSDFFTYHIITLQLITVFANSINSIAFFSKRYQIFVSTYYLASFAWFVELGFNVLACVEHYLAVVHPITYLNLKNEKGIKMRNFSAGCVWLLGFVFNSLLRQDFFQILNFCFLLLSITTVFFCNISVLCVLAHQGPGDQEGGIKKVSQSKLRAFYTIISMLIVLVLWFGFCLVWTILLESKYNFNCLMVASEIWFNLPGSVTSPLLYLHRKRKLMCSKKSAK